MIEKEATPDKPSNKISTGSFSRRRACGFFSSTERMPRYYHLYLLGNTEW